MSLFRAIEGREDRAPACSARHSPTPLFALPFRFPTIRRSDASFASPNSSAEPFRTDLSPLSPHCYQLFMVTKSVNSLVFNQFHTLVANHPGWGCPCRLQASSFKPPDRTSSLQNRTKPCTLNHPTQSPAPPVVSIAPPPDGNAAPSPATLPPDSALTTLRQNGPLTSAKCSPATLSISRGLKASTTPSALSTISSPKDASRPAAPPFLLTSAASSSAPSPPSITTTSITPMTMMKRKSKP